MSQHNSNTFFEQYFEDRLAQIEPRLVRWARWKYSMAPDYDREEALQDTRIVLWKRYSDNPEQWAPMPKEQWLAYARGTFHYAMLSRYGARQRKPVKHASEMDCIINDQDITDDEAISMAKLGSRSTPNQFARSREIHLAELRIDLERAVARGLRRLCKSQRRDMPLLISDMLAGYTLDEITARHGWTRNRGVTLMRKLRTVVYEELTGQQKTGYLGSHHPLTEAEKARIRELYATGLSYRKVAARVGRSASAVEGVCKQYPPEIVAQVRTLRRQGCSYQAISEQVGRAKSYIGWLIMAEGIDRHAQHREGDDLAPVPVDM